MSWNQYIDNLIAQSSQNCDKACIIGFDGSQWTTKEHPNNLNLSNQEIATITKILSKFSIYGSSVHDLKPSFKIKCDREFQNKSYTFSKVGGGEG